MSPATRETRPPPTLSRASHPGRRRCAFPRERHRQQRIEPLEIGISLESHRRSCQSISSDRAVLRQLEPDKRGRSGLGLGTFRIGQPDRASRIAARAVDHELVQSCRHGRPFDPDHLAIERLRIRQHVADGDVDDLRSGRKASTSSAIVEGFNGKAKLTMKKALAFVPTEPSKSRCIKRLATYLYPTQSTDSAEQPKIFAIRG